VGMKGGDCFKTKADFQIEIEERKPGGAKKVAKKERLGTWAQSFRPLAQRIMGGGGGHVFKRCGPGEIREERGYLAPSEGGARPKEYIGEGANYTGQPKEKKRYEFA